MEIFKDMKVDGVIEGGQTMNPSTESFLEAIDKINAKSIIILPNNSNIFLAAQQAAHMSKKDVHVLNTKTVPEGIAAMYSFNTDLNVKNNLEEMAIAVENTSTGQITYSIKDSTYKGKEIKKGDILCILNGEIVHVKNNAQDGALAIIEMMTEDNTPEFMNIYYGEDVNEEEANQLKDHIEDLNGDIEVEVKDGGQSLYYYLISAE